jgi:hypothetical protein
MNELTKEKTMTVKQISILLDVSDKTVKREIRKLYPLKMQARKITRLTKDEAAKIIGEIKIQTKNHLGQNVPVNVLDEKLNKLETIVFSLAEIVKNQIEQTNKLLNQPNIKQIEIKQDYFSLKAFCIKKGIKTISVSELRGIGKEASKLSKENNIEIRKVEDEQWGLVNSYHISILEKLFEI